MFATLGTFGVGRGAEACTKTWNPSGNAPRPWSTPGNWSPSGVPGSTDDVCLDGSVASQNKSIQIDVAASAKTLTVASTFSKAMNVTAGVTIHVYGDVNYAGTGAFDSGTNAGNIMIDGALTVSSGSGTFNVANNGTTTTVSGAVTLASTLATSAGAFVAGGNLTVTTGTFTGGSGSVQIGGNLSVTGSGTFNGGSGLLTILGNLGPLSSGTFRATSGTTQIAGAFNHSSGNTYNDHNGNLLFNATVSQTHTFGGATFKKVTFNDGMVAYWNLDQTTGSNNTDNSGYGNTGNPTNVTQSSNSQPPLDFNGSRYATFDGSTSYISATVLKFPAANAVQSISAWVNITALPTSASSLVALTGTSSAVKLGLSPTSLRVLRNDGTALVTTSAPSIGAWHHVAYVWDGTFNRLYVDGVAATPTMTTHDGGAVTYAFLGATGGASPADFFSGALDEVRIYNRALATSEISSLALGGTPAGGIATHTFSDDYLSTVGTNVADLVIASGIVSASGNVTVEGSWLNYGGRFTGTGAVTMTSNGGETILSGGSSFPSLTFNGTGGSGTHTLYDRLWIPNGTLTLASTTKLSLGAYTAHVGTISVASGATFTPSTGTVVLDGTSDQTLSSALTTFYGLHLEDPSELGLVGYWKLDEGAGPSSTRDWSGMNNTGTLSSSGATWAAACGSIGFDDATAMSFDGVAGYVSVGTSSLPAANAAQSLSAWVNISALPGSSSTIVALGGASSAVNLGLSATNLRVLRNDGTALISRSAPSTGTWHQIVYTWDGTNNQLYIDGVATTSTTTSHDAAAVTAAFIGASSAASGFFNGSIDDVRVYNVALTQAQVTRLAAGLYAGTGGYATVTLGANTTVSRTFALDAANLASSNFTLGATLATAAATINAGTYEVGGGGASTAAAQTFSGGLTVRSAGTLKMATTGGSVQIANNKSLLVDGTLRASSTGATIQSVSGSYTFQVGATPNATPTLNVTGLAIKNTNASGMSINADTTATTTFTRFDNIAFSNGTNTSSGILLQIYSKSLILTSNGCTFDDGITATTKFTVKLTGNGHTGSPDTTQTRALFGGASCSSSYTSCQASKSDDDSNSDGLPSNPGTNGAVVQFVRAAEADTAGTAVGLPVAAFDWNDYSYYSTYVSYNSASGSSSSIYVRNGSGAAQYSWTSPGADTMVGTPRYATSGTTHYLYVAMSSGKIYQLVDTGAALTTVGAAWPTNPYDCTCTIVTPLGMDTTNLYWGGKQSGNKIWTLGIASEGQPMGSPFSVTPAVTTASPAIWTSGATTYAFVGTAGHILQIDVSNQALTADNSNPGSASVWGRVALGSSSPNRILAGDDGGHFWSLDPTNFAGTNKVWTYAVAGDSIKSSPFYHYSTNTVAFGTEAGKVVVLDSTGTPLTGYPYAVATASDPIEAAVFYWSGVLVIGTNTGKLFFIDRNNGTTGPTLLSQYYFGSTEVVSGIGYDANSSRYMVSVADPSAKDGKIYYFDNASPLTGDPTPTYP